jgi:hypothetical protein
MWANLNSMTSPFAHTVPGEKRITTNRVKRIPPKIAWCPSRITCTSFMGFNDFSFPLHGCTGRGIKPASAKCWSVNKHFWVWRGQAKIKVAIICLYGPRNRCFQGLYVRFNLKKSLKTGCFSGNYSSISSNLLCPTRVVIYSTFLKPCLVIIA